MTAKPTTDHRCPHCGGELSPFKMPEESGWNGETHFACFNDECSYYVEGWEWMQQNYEVKSSYRYRIEPETGVASPLAVWSSMAVRDRIIKE
jgi:hypothetical protein